MKLFFSASTVVCLIAANALANDSAKQPVLYRFQPGQEFAKSCQAAGYIGNFRFKKVDAYEFLFSFVNIDISCQGTFTQN